MLGVFVGMGVSHALPDAPESRRDLLQEFGAPYLERYSTNRNVEDRMADNLTT
jgi:hypothetical protein